jgi:WD40 repeat protein
VANLETGSTTNYTLTQGGIQNSITALALAPGGKRAIVGSQDGSVRLLELAPPDSGQETGTVRSTRTTRKQQYAVSRLGFSSEGRSAFSLTGGYYGSPSLVVWDVVHWRDFHTLPHDDRREVPTCAAFSPDGGFLLSGTSAGAIHKWDVATGERLRTYRQYQSALLGWKSSVRMVAVLPDGTSALSWADNDSVLRQWSLAD